MKKNMLSVVNVAMYKNNAENISMDNKAIK